MHENSRRCAVQVGYEEEAMTYSVTGMQHSPLIMERKREQLGFTNASPPEATNKERNGADRGFFVASRHDTKEAEREKGILSHDSGGEGGGLVVGISCHQFPSWLFCSRFVNGCSQFPPLNSLS